MGAHAVIDLESNIAQGRIVLSLVTLVAVFVDPTTPHLAAWIHVTSGPFMIDTHLLQVLCFHTLYSVTIYVASRRPDGTAHLPAISTVCDVAFAGLVTLFTESPTTPSFVF